VFAPAEGLDSKRFMGRTWGAEINNFDSLTQFLE
jgi:hypothetical protein